jgi:hypothetical protein
MTDERERRRLAEAGLTSLRRALAQDPIDAGAVETIAADLVDVDEETLASLEASTAAVMAAAGPTRPNAELLAARLLMVAEAAPQAVWSAGAAALADRDVDRRLGDASRHARAQGDQRCASRCDSWLARRRLMEGDLPAAGDAYERVPDEVEITHAAVRRSLTAFASWTRHGRTTELVTALRAEVASPDRIDDTGLPTHLLRLALTFAGDPSVHDENPRSPDRAADADPVCAVIGELCHGLVASELGHIDHARGSLLDAHQLAEDQGLTWMAAFSSALAAEALAPGNHLVAVQLADRSAATADRLGDDWLHRLTRRARAVVALETGEHAVAIRLASDDLASAEDPLSRGHLLLVAGRSHLAGRDAGPAVAELVEAATELTAAGARLAATRAWLAASEADPANAEDLLRRAGAIGSAETSEAYRRCWQQRRNLRLELLGHGRLLIGDDVVTPKTANAAKLVISLALAGRSGLDAATLCERLWPDKDADDAATNLTTATWDARRALGPEAWRLRREDERLHLDADGVRIDLLEVLAEAEQVTARPPAGRLDMAGVATRLRRPVLPEWTYDDWVDDLDQQRAAALARLESRRADIPRTPS